MIPSQIADDRLRRAFAPTQGGIVGLTDQLLEACVGSDVEFKRVGEQCVCNWTVSEETQQAVVPLPPSAFRTILARIAALCQEHSPNTVTPYGGEGLLTVKGPPPTVIRVAFVNTPNEQRLEVRRDAENSQPSLLGGSDAALQAAIEPLAAYISASSNPRGALVHAVELLLKAELFSIDQATAEALATLRHAGHASESRANKPAEPGAAPDPVA